MSTTGNSSVWVQYSPAYSHPYDLEGMLVWEFVLTGNTDVYPKGKGSMPFETTFMYRGENKTVHVYVKDQNQNPIIVTGAVATLTIKDVKGTAATVLIQKVTNIPAQGNLGATDKGELYFYLLPADTLTLDIRQYVFDVKISLANGKQYTVLDGVINLKETVA